jgi:hypothetical protein
MSNVLPPNTDPEMAARFFDAWFGRDFDEQYVTVSQMAPGSKRGMRTIHTHVHPHEAASMFREFGMDDLVYFRDVQWNLYMSVGAMHDKPEGKRKGGRRDITKVPGIWVDLDTDKSGFFDDEEECLALLRTLPQEAWPTIVVATGTGGVHAYWKTQEALDPEEAEVLCTMWWTYLSTRTEKKIDKLVNADRIMKLPGSVRWPKAEHDAPSLVRLLYCDATLRVSAETLRRLSQDTWDRHQNDIAERRERVRRSRLEATREVLNVEGRWGMLMSLATIEDDFNLQYSWDDILLPLGWTKIDQDGEGRDIWARPGLADYELHKSAATDYEGSHVMSLFSDSAETGLSHLLDTGTTLTKYRVFVECVWGGDEAAFVRAYLSGGETQ